MSVRARKKSVNLSLDQHVVATARRLTDNLSAEVEELLREFVAHQSEIREAEVEGLRRSAAAWDEFAARNGSLADEFSTL